MESTPSTASTSPRSEVEPLVLECISLFRAEFEAKSVHVVPRRETEGEEEGVLGGVVPSRSRRRSRHSDSILNITPEQAAEAGPKFARRLLKALLTICDFDVSDPLSDKIERLLALERESTPLTSHTSLPNFNSRALLPSVKVSLWQGDITTLEIDAIVNAANSQMLGCFIPFHACIDNVIHDKAGPRLRSACRRFMSAQGHLEGTGLAKITPAYALPARFVLHTVGPIVDEQHPEPQPLLLTQSYRSCLEAAKGAGARSVAFCCISTGVFGYPKRPAAQVALLAVREWLEEKEENRAALDHIVFNVFTAEDLDIYDELIGPAWSDTPQGMDLDSAD